jgi:hypothetical protein
MQQFSPILFIAMVWVVPLVQSCFQCIVSWICYQPPVNNLAFSWETAYVLWHVVFGYAGRGRAFDSLLNLTRGHGQISIGHEQKKDKQGFKSLPL